MLPLKLAVEPQTIIFTTKETCVFPVQNMECWNNPEVGKWFLGKNLNRTGFWEAIYLAHWNSNSIT
jgi:hypothetical protein